MADTSRPIPRRTIEPDIHDFLCWKAYIRAYLGAAPSRNQARLAKALGCSEALVTKILKSRSGDSRALIVRHVDAFIRALSLTRAEAEVFRALVQLSQSAEGSAEQREAELLVLSLRRLHRAHHLKVRELDYLTDPYAVIVRELARSPHFQTNPQWIQDVLLEAVDAEALETTLAVLERLDLPQHESISEGTDPDDSDGVVVDDALKLRETELVAAFKQALIHNHRKGLARAAEVLTELGPEDRYVNAVTALVPEEALPELREQFKRWMGEGAALVERRSGDSSTRARVVRLGLYMFPHTEWVGPEAPVVTEDDTDRE